MQLILYFLFAAVSGGNALSHWSTILKETVSDDRFHHFLHNHTHTSAVKSCSNFEQDMKNATHKTKECIQKEFDPDLENICHFITNKLRACTKPPTDLLVRCLPQKSKDIPNLIIDMVLSLWSYICTAKGSELLELSLPCITHTLSDPDEDNLCKIQLESKLVEFADDLPTKTTFCEFMKAHRQCLERRIEEQCSSTITRRNFFKFYDAMDQPCRSPNMQKTN